MDFRATKTGISLRMPNVTSSHGSGGRPRSHPTRPNERPERGSLVLSLGEPMGRRSSPSGEPAPVQVRTSGLTPWRPQTPGHDLAAQGRRPRVRPAFRGRPPLRPPAAHRPPPTAHRPPLDSCPRVWAGLECSPLNITEQGPASYGL